MGEEDEKRKKSGVDHSISIRVAAKTPHPCCYADTNIYTQKREREKNELHRVESRTFE